MSNLLSATGVITFPMARRVKTWLRANMQQKRFNDVAIVHCHKERTVLQKETSKVLIGVYYEISVSLIDIALYKF